MITEPTALFVYLACVLGVILWASGLPQLQRVVKITPAVIYAYFIPTLSTSFGITPMASPTYDWMIRYLLPFSLLLLMVTVDVRAILRLGKMALIMMLVGSAGIVIGGPVALALFGHWLPSDAWLGMAALSGSWIGGSANMIAIKESVGTPDSLMGPLIVVDTAVGYSWVGVLLFLSAFQGRFDRFVRADTNVLESVNARLAKAEDVQRPATLRDMGMMLALGFGGGYVCIWLGNVLPELGDPKIVSHTTWAVLLATVFGLGLSFTRVAKLDEVGASRLGYLALYLLLTAIGAQADLLKVLEAPLYLGVGVFWIAFHAVLLFGAAYLLKAPLFFVATGSTANIGGAATASIVASVYHRAMMPVGLLMGVSGYIIGMFGGLACAWLLARVAGL